jgi:hypothetical protein
MQHNRIWLPIVRKKCILSARRMGNNIENPARNPFSWKQKKIYSICAVCMLTIHIGLHTGTVQQPRFCLKLTKKTCSATVYPPPPHISSPITNLERVIGPRVLGPDWFVFDSCEAISNSGRAKAKMPPTEYCAWPIRLPTGESSRERNLHRMRKATKKMDCLSLHT